MDFIKETLDWVNRKRDWYGIGPALEDLPPGARKNGCDCPLARALQADYVGCGIVAPHLDADDETYLLPACAEEFIREFDAGELPQYDVNA